MELAQAYYRGDEPSLFSIRDSWTVRRQQDVIDYILFLYFGDLRNRFQKFVLRDLGVVKTRGKADKATARFDDIDAARSAFEIYRLRRDYLSDPEACRSRATDYVTTNRPVGPSAKKSWDKLVLALGADTVTQDPTMAIRLWSRSDHPKSFESWVRAKYSHEGRESLRSELETLKEKP